jgi:hypothetical protein
MEKESQKKEKKEKKEKKKKHCSFFFLFSGHDVTHREPISWVTSMNMDKVRL